MRSELRHKEIVQRLAKATMWCTLAATLSSAFSHGQAFTASSDARVSLALLSQSGEACDARSIGSPYIDVDSWVYPAALRLFALGYGDSMYLGLRPWTRDSLRRALQEAPPQLFTDGTESTVQDQALEIYAALMREVAPIATNVCEPSGVHPTPESAYAQIRGISGVPLRDSYHLGSSVINDYGRPYAAGANTYSGASGYATAGRFAAYVRGELQTAPSLAGYSASLATSLAVLDTIRSVNPATGKPFILATVPYGNTGSVRRLNMLEGYVSANVLNHVFSFGKVDQWLGPAQGASMAYSNSAENVYAFQINRIEPLRIPLLSRITGPFRYEFLVGPLQGYSYIPPDSTHFVLPGDPWIHVEKISFKPTRNFELGFSRTVIWGGQGHEPVNLHTFIRSFISTVNVSYAVKNSDQDPGARYSSFDATYRVPGLRNSVLFYVDTEVHDSVSPPSNPAIMAYRSGLYLSHLPHTPRLDFRIEAANTDPSTSRSVAGSYMYWEYLQKQGYTNKGVLFGDWIGREGKGGQAWMTYNLSPDQWVQMTYRRKKNATDFIAGGTTLDEIGAHVLKRLRRVWELNADLTYQKYQAPIFKSSSQNVFITDFRVTRYFK
jgi:hypothetical protein